MLTDGDVIRAAETDEEVLTFDVSDDALERATLIVGGQATPVTLSWAIAPAPCSKIGSWREFCATRASARPLHYANGSYGYPA